MKWKKEAERLQMELRQVKEKLGLVPSIFLLSPKELANNPDANNLVLNKDQWNVRDEGDAIWVSLKLNPPPIEGDLN